MTTHTEDRPTVDRARLVRTLADDAIRDVQSWVAGWDGPIPTADNLHDLCDANMVVHDALDRAGLVPDEWFDLNDESADSMLALFNDVFDAILADERVDTDAPGHVIDTYYRALWGRDRT